MAAFAVPLPTASSTCKPGTSSPGEDTDLELAPVTRDAPRGFPRRRKWFELLEVTPAPADRGNCFNSRARLAVPSAQGGRRHRSEISSLHVGLGLADYTSASATARVKCEAFQPCRLPCSTARHLAKTDPDLWAPFNRKRRQQITSS